MSPDEYDDIPTLYDAVHSHDEDIVITHESNPAWHMAVLNGADSLSALRHVVDDNLLSITILHSLVPSLTTCPRAPKAVDPTKDGRVPSRIAFVSNDNFFIVTLIGINLINT